MGGGGMEGWEGGKTPPRGENSHRDPVSRAGSDDDWRNCDSDSGVYAAEQSRHGKTRHGKTRQGKARSGGQGRALGDVSAGEDWTVT